MKRLHLTTLVLAASLTAASAGAAIAQNGGYYDSAHSATGTIAVVNGSNVRLRDGRNVFLKSGTVINPRGVRLQPGMRIAVQGSRGGNGAINATNVQVLGWQNGQPNSYNH